MLYHREHSHKMLTLHNIHQQPSQHSIVKYLSTVRNIPFCCENEESRCSKHHFSTVSAFPRAQSIETASASAHDMLTLYASPTEPLEAKFKKILNKKVSNMYLYASRQDCPVLRTPHRCQTTRYDRARHTGPRCRSASASESASTAAGETLPARTACS